MSVVKTEIDPLGVMRMTLNRPEVHNAFNQDMIIELKECFLMMGRQDSVRCIVLSGMGKSFSAGADLNWMRAAASATELENHHDALHMAQMFEAINACPKPVIGMVHGACLGGGVGLVACCDIVVAHAKTTFGLTEVRLGLIPAAIAPFVTAKIGQSQARRYMITGERFSAKQAQFMGLIHEISDHPLDVLDTMIGEIVKNANGAMADVKDLIKTIAHREINSDILELTSRRIAKRRASSEGIEGVTAFLEKRQPKWITSLAIKPNETKA